MTADKGAQKDANSRCHESNLPLRDDSVLWYLQMSSPEDKR